MGDDIAFLARGDGNSPVDCSHYSGEGGSGGNFTNGEGSN